MIKCFKTICKIAETIVIMAIVFGFCSLMLMFLGASVVELFESLSKIIGKI